MLTDTQQQKLFKPISNKLSSITMELRDSGSGLDIDVTKGDMELEDPSYLEYLLDNTGITHNTSNMYSTNTTVYNDTWALNDTSLSDVALGDTLMPVVPWWHTVLIATVMFTIIFSAILGNLLVIISVFTFRNLQIISNSFIVSLAFADLTVALCVMSFSASQSIAGRWLFGQTICDLFNANDVLFCTASLIHLCCISMDRYIAITDPFHYHSRMTKRKVAFMLFMAWSLSVAISHIPVHTRIYAEEGFELIIHPYSDAPEVGLCLFVVNPVYAIISSCTSFWIPTFIMVFTYAMVFREARRQEKSMLKHLPVGRSSVSETEAFRAVTSAPNGNHHSNGASPQNGANGYEPRRLSNERNKLKREHKAAKTLGIIMSGFLLCWLPFFLWYVITTLCGAERCPTPDWVIAVLFWVGYCNSALNPIIYAFFNTEFRKAFITLLKCQTIRRMCTSFCCHFCVRRGWIRRASDQESSYLAGLPPRHSRPSITPSATDRKNSYGNDRKNSYFNGSKFSRTKYDTVCEKEELTG